MNEKENLRAKLDALDSKIEQARSRMRLSGLFHKDHDATADELQERYKLLAEQVDAAVDGLEAQGVHTNSFEKSVLSWLNSINLDR